MRWGILSALALLLVAAQPALAQGGRIAFDAGDEIFTIRADGSEPTRLTSSPGETESGQPDWSPDGTRIAFSRGSETTRLWTMAADGSDARALSRSRARNRLEVSPDWSPDGARIAFARYSFGKRAIVSSIVVTDTSGTRERVLTSVREGHLAGVDEPAWSPDGTRILFTRSRVGGSNLRADLWVLDVATGKKQRLAREARGGAWSPDGSRIAFASTRDRNGEDCGEDLCTDDGELYVMGADGSGPTRLTTEIGDEQTPTWSPDGAAIVFDSSRNAPDSEQREIYAIRPDGSCLTWLTNGVASSRSPDWQPGSGGMPDSAGCGATPRPPAGLLTPKDKGLWMGQIGPRNVLLTDTSDGMLDYSDCASFDPAQCGPAILIQTGSGCRAHPLRIDPEPAFRFELRRGALVYLTAGDATVYSGSEATDVFGNPDPGVVDVAIGALRPLPSADPVDALAPPRFPASVIALIERARRLGSVRRVTRRMHRSRARARQLLDLAKAVEPLGKLQPADCPKR
jgi:Tol biopolymer transport system component